ncbi:MAG: hypothetical protein E7644_01930 [Ruminococcaceae bacterium]|nr:hypothetical protein [Oscillospiraceae bacterium]
MDILKKFWPSAFKLQKGEVRPFVIQLIIFVVVAAVLGVLMGFLGGIKIVGFIFAILGTLIDLYCTAGIVFSILRFVGVFKD